LDSNPVDNPPKAAVRDLRRVDIHPDHWYPLAWSREVKRGKTHAVRFAGEPIVLARTESGKVIALEDRCAHRQVPLSQGCARAGGIECPYHGWSFGPDGRLLGIPGMPADGELPAVRVPCYEVRELDGLVWLRPGASGEDAPSALVRALDPSTRRFLWQTTWHANVVDAMENFMDPMHTHGIHPGMVRKGDGGRARASATLQGTQEGFHVEYAGQPVQSGLLYRLFESPRTLERMHFAAPGSTQIEYRYANGSVVRISLHFTPRTSLLTDVYATLHVEKRWAPAWAVRLFVWPFLRRVNDQDARVLALQSENLRRFPGRRGASTALDIVRPELEKFWSGAGLSGPSLHRRVDMLL
jgi:phenylpropionate dioxygenase-like ring-hydroxylating dioxygenase large terminal subunit